MADIDNSQIKILLVDDTPVNLEIAGKVLEKEGYDLYIADNGFTAVDLVRDTAFDLILLDIMMPEMDGFETCRKIKENVNNRDIPIIFLTAKADIESIVTGFELGAVDYIRKPFNSMELHARVKNHIELRKTREELKLKNLRLQEAYEQLMVIAKTDPLTRLFNRREMLERMEYEKTRYEKMKAPYTVVIGDIDLFKNINDSYGHEFGDTVLVAISDIFKNNTRMQDSVGRWGGEEFLLLLPDTTEAEAAVLADKLRMLVEKTAFSHENKQINVTITFGVCGYKDGLSLVTLISDADRALYEGKNRGRNCIVCCSC